MVMQRLLGLLLLLGRRRQSFCRNIKLLLIWRSLGKQGNLGKPFFKVDRRTLSLGRIQEKCWGVCLRIWFKATIRKDKIISRGSRTRNDLFK